MKETIIKIPCRIGDVVSVIGTIVMETTYDGEISFPQYTPEPNRFTGKVMGIGYNVRVIMPDCDDINITYSLELDTGYNNSITTVRVASSSMIFNTGEEAKTAFYNMTSSDS